MRWILYRKLSIQWIWINERYVTVWMKVLVNEKWMRQLLWRLDWTESDHFAYMDRYLIISRAGVIGIYYWMRKDITISDLVIWDSGRWAGGICSLYSWISIMNIIRRWCSIQLICFVIRSCLHYINRSRSWMSNNRTTSYNEYQINIKSHL